MKRYQLLGLSLAMPALALASLAMTAPRGQAVTPSDLAFHSDRMAQAEDRLVPRSSTEKTQRSSAQELRQGLIYID
jgi:hypothetical protein